MAKSRSYRKRKSGSRKGSRKYKSRGRKSHKKSKSRKSRGKSRSRKYKSRKSKSRRSKKSKSRKGSRKSRKGSRKSRRSRVRKTHKKSPCKGLSQYDCNINPNCDYTTTKAGTSYCKARSGTLYKRKLSDKLNVFAGPMGRASSFSNPAGYGEGVTLSNYGPSQSIRRCYPPVLKGMEPFCI